MAPRLKAGESLSPVLLAEAAQGSGAQSIKLIGLGGIGQIVARYLCLFLASCREPVRLCLIDGDAFEHSNASRMLFERLGNKAEVTLAELADRFADSCLTLTAIGQYVSEENITRLIREGDIVLLSVDNHATRRLISRHVGTLADAVLISGGNDGVESRQAGTGRPLRGTWCNVQVYIRRGGRDASPSLTRFHPEIETPPDRSPTDQSCAELAAAVPQILFANLAAASAILNAFWLHVCGAIHYSELAADIADGLMRPLPIPPPDLDTA